jgi:sugar phosphate isomerase/epimerase
VHVAPDDRSVVCEPEPTGEMMATIGVQASTIKHAFARLGTEETLRRVTELGYRAIEISQVPMTPENVEAMRRAQDERGLRIAALSASMTPHPGTAGESLTTAFSKIVADCHALGTTFLRIGMLPVDAMGSRETVLAFAAQADTMAERLRGEGIDLHYHNHHVEFARFDGRPMLDLIADNAPRLGLELDVHWIHRGGVDPVTELRRHAGRARLIHLKDYRIGTLPQSAIDAIAAGDASGFATAFAALVQFAEVGQGTLDWPSIIDTSLAGGAEYLFVEQDDTYGRDPFDSLAMSRDHLVSIGYGDLF